MTETPQQDRVNTENLRDYRQLRRSLTDRKVAGVAGGLGRHLNIDPTIVRVLFVVLCFFGGAGFVLYGAAWLFVPEEGKSESLIGTSPSTRNTLLIIAAVVAGLLLISDSWGGFWFPWPLAVIALIVFLVMSNRDKPPVTPPPADEVAAYPAIEPAIAPKPDRGPKLFWITIALVAIALGTLGLYDESGGSVVDAAYPALALTVVGAMLLVGAWAGRAGGLIFLGIVAAIALAVTATVGPNFRGDRQIEASPVRAAQVKDRYAVPAGSIHLDLSDIEDLDQLDGRHIRVEANVGELVITVPDGVDVDVRAEVAIAGEAVVFDDIHHGPDVLIERQFDGGADAPQIELDVQLFVGSIEVSQSEVRQS